MSKGGTVSVQITACLNPFSTEKTEFSFESGISINEIIKKIDPLNAVNTGWRVLFDDEIITDFERIPEENQHVYIKLVPEGDNKEMGTGMKIGGGILTALGVVLACIPATNGIGVALIGAGIGMVAGGITLYNLEIPKLEDREKPEQDPSIRGSRNQSRPYGVLPTLFGRRRIYADVCANPYTWVDPADGSVYLYQLFCAGQKDISIEPESFKIDETFIKDYSSSKSINQILDRNNPDPLISIQIASGESVPPLYAKCVHEIQLNSILKHQTDEGLDGAIVRTTPDNTTEINVDIFAYNGLGKYDDKGKLGSVSVEIKAEYKLASEPDSSYIPLGYFSNGTNVISGQHLKTKRYAITKTGLGAASYTVRLTRISADSTDSKIVDTIYAGSIRACKNELPVREEICQRTTLIGLKIKASEKLNNTVEQLNFIAQSINPVYDSVSDTWHPSLTSNPASAAMYAMQGDFAQQKLGDSEIDLNAFEKLYMWCEEHQYECNAYLCENMTISSLLAAIASVCRAEIFRINGKIAVVQDIARDAPVQLFSPRNSWGYKETMSLSDIPDEMKMQFADEDSGFADNEVSVYNTTDGNKIKEPVTSQNVRLWGVTNHKQAQKIGLYNYAVSNHRFTVIKFSCDFEYLMCRKGDWIKYAGDIALAGITQGRINEYVMENDRVIGFECDEEISMQQGNEYVLRIRKSSGELILLSLINCGQTGNVVYLENSISLQESPEKGCLFAFGIRGNEASDLIVSDIQCGDDLSADLTCVEYSPEIFGLDNQGFILPDYINRLSEVSAKVDAGEVSNWKTWTSYNDSEQKPSRPSGDGTANGWHYMQTSESKWISTKTAESINAGEWSEPIPTGQFSVGIILEGNTSIESPAIPVDVSAVAEQDKIVLSCRLSGNGLSNSLLAFYWEYRKSRNDGWSSLNSSEYIFDRDVDGYPEKEDFENWEFRVRAKNIYYKYSDYVSCNVDTSIYGTWQVSPPVIKSRVSDRTVTLQFGNEERAVYKKQYGEIRYKVQVARYDDLVYTENSHSELQFFEPDVNANPRPVRDSNGNVLISNEDNYKTESTELCAISGSTYTQIMPLKHQDGNAWLDEHGEAQKGAIDTEYIFKVVAYNAGVKNGNIISEPRYVNVIALCTNIQDLVYANESVKEQYVQKLSAICANIGVITQGSFSGNQYNLWALSDIDAASSPTGKAIRSGSFRVGGKDKYLEVTPLIDEGTGLVYDYDFTLHVGAFEISSERTLLNSELIIFNSEISEFDRTRITTDGSFYEHRNTTDSPWITVAKQETGGTMSRSLYSTDKLLLTNAKISERRKAGFDIGKPYLSANSKIYHFDENWKDQNGEQSYSIETTQGSDFLPVIIGKDNLMYDCNGSYLGRKESELSFKPAILAVAPYSDTARSLYGVFKLTFDLHNSNTFTVDFWIKFYYAENQVLFDIGTDQDRIQFICLSGEPNYNVPQTYNGIPEPPYNYETKQTDALVYNHAQVSAKDMYVKHQGVSTFEIRSLGTVSGKELCTEGSWTHFAVVMTENTISCFIQDEKIEFARYSSTHTNTTAVINDNTDRKHVIRPDGSEFENREHSAILDELFVDESAAETFESFKQTTENKIPWGSLPYTDDYMVLVAKEDSNGKPLIKTNIFNSDEFKAAVQAVIDSQE